MRCIRLLSAPLITALLVGCAPQGQQREVEYRLAGVEDQLADTRLALQTERAKTAALQRSVATERREWEATKAEANSLKSRVAELTKSRADLQAQIRARVEQPLSRPEVPASPLPASTDQALQTFVSKYGRRVWYDRGRGAVSFANDRLFETGSDTVRADAHAALGELAGIAARPAARDLEVIVVGHTDDTPITKPETRALHPSNWHLSVHRAIAVKDVLVSAGLPTRRLAVMGYGPNRPVSDDRTRNRRVEVFLVRKGEVQARSPVRPAQEP